MDRGILIAGNGSALLSAIEIEAAKRVEHYALAQIPNRFSGAEAKTAPLRRKENSPVESSVVFPSAYASLEKIRLPLDWNPGSPISARTLVLAAENRLGHIDDAILVCDPPSSGCSAAGLGFADVEVMVNDHIKGWFFLVKELAAAFRARGGGTLVLVYPETVGKDNADDPLGPAALAAFHSLTGSLLAAATGEPYLVQGFAGGETGDETGFASFIFKQLEDGIRRVNGKLHKYGKLGLFR